MKKSADQQECAGGIAFDAALRLLASNAQPLGTEVVPLAKAGRRCLAAPVIARLDAPRFDVAAMDGFAVRAADLSAGAKQLRVVGSSFPGQSFATALAPGEAVRITTGGQIPAGADHVVLREFADVDGELIVLHQQLAPRTHIRSRASDFASGATILQTGVLIQPRSLVAAAAADVAKVTAWRRPSVAVLASGDELVAPGEASQSSQGLPDSLSEAVLLMCSQWGAKPVASARVADDPASIERAASELLEQCDVLLLVGGASRGGRDFAKIGLAPLGLRVAFADVEMKPGKPAWYGRIGVRHVLGLPGNPTAAMTVARLFLVPLLTTLGGRGFEAGLAWADLPLNSPAEANAGRESFLCAERVGGGIQILERQSASSQALLARADVLVRRPMSASPREPGDLVPTLRF